MPSVKIPKKSTHVDMTPFVDVAFLILTFFIMATKFKPPEPVEIETPNSVNSGEIEDVNSILINLDKNGKVYFSMQTVNNDPQPKLELIRNLNTTRNLNLTDAEMANYLKTAAVGVPFNKLKSLLAVPADEHKSIVQEGIPVKDSLNNELYFWVRDAVSVFSGSKINYLIKGDNAAKYPDFKRILEAFKRNDIYKFNLITMPEDAPLGTDLWKTRQAQKEGKQPKS